MGLKCSIIGHKYGEAAVERDREEQGSEVVITIQERETCERCGKTRIVSENKEVTAIETPADIADDVIEDEEAADEGESAAVDETGEEDEPAASEGITMSDSVDSGADDAEILDDDGASTGGDSELSDPSTEVAVSEAEPGEQSIDADEAATQDADSDDGVIIDGDEEPSEQDDRRPGEWPQEPEDNDDDWAPETGTTEDEAETEESPDVEPFGGPAVTVPSGEFRCRECGFTTDVASSSLRAGDFCPECHKGALVQTEESERKG